MSFSNLYICVYTTNWPILTFKNFTDASAPTENMQYPAGMGWEGKWVGSEGGLLKIMKQMVPYPLPEGKPVMLLKWVSLDLFY